MRALCRILGHRWRVQYASYGRTFLGDLFQVASERCRRCPAERVRLLK